MHNAAFASAAGLFSRLLTRWRSPNQSEIEHQSRALLTQWEFLVLQLPNPVARSASVGWAHQAVRFAKSGRRATAAHCMNRAMGYFRGA
jgi:hypothetical protein